jgi:ribosomal protein S18 acetylase RimI-like enzyme
MEIKDATKDQARDLAFLTNLAGEGIPEYLWREMAGSDEIPLDIGAARVVGETGGFSYKNARVCVRNGEVLGMIISYRLPDPYDIGDISEYPEIVRPLILLEAKVPGSWYINAIATFERFRGMGVAKKLMQDTENQARRQNCRQVSLIVANENDLAKQLYEYLDYKEVSSVPVIPYSGCMHGGQWSLMIKELKWA